MRYLGGSSTAVVRGDFVLLVDPVSQQRVDELWALADAELDVVRLLDVLGTDGIAAMPRFAAAMRHGEQFRVVVRGTFVVHVETPAGTITCDGMGVATWSERAFPVADVTAVRLATGEGAGATALPILAGVVSAAEVFTDAGSGGWEPVSVAAEPVAESLAESLAVAEPVVAEVPEPAPEPAAADDRNREPLPEPDPQRNPSGQPVSPDETLVDASEEAYDAMFGATVAGRTPEDAAVREAEVTVSEQVAPPPSSGVESPASPEAVVGDHDHRTMTPAEFAQLQGRGAAGQSGAAMPPGPVTPPPVPQVLLRFSTGREVPVDRPVVVGRSPRAVNTSSAMLPTLVVLDDPYVSGTHLEFAMVDGGLMGTDRSTNGTMLAMPGQSPALMVGGRPTGLATGSVLHVTDLISITVVAP